MKKPETDKCPNCEIASEALKCPLCEGTGRIAIATDFELGIGPSRKREYVECDNCDGIGLIRVTPFIKNFILGGKNGKS